MMVTLHNYLLVIWAYVLAHPLVVSLVVAPIVNEIYQRLPTKGQSIIQGIAHYLLTLPGIGQVIAKVPAVGDLLYIFAPSDRTAYPKPLSVLAIKRVRGKKAAAENPPAETPSTIPPTAVLLVFFTLSLSACAFGQALGKCELNQLPQTLQSGIACAVSASGVASQTGEGAQSAISGCVSSLAPAQASCLITSVVAWLEGSIPAHSAPRPETLTALKHLKTWIAAHPTTSSCDGLNPVLPVS